MWGVMGEEPGGTIQDGRRHAGKLGTASQHKPGCIRKAAIGATTAVALIAAGAAAAQHLRADRSTNITVRVLGTLSVEMPDVPAACSHCVVLVSVSSNWNLPPGAAMGVTFRTQVTDSRARPGSAVSHRTFVKGRGTSSLLVRLKPNRDVEPMIVTIEAQNY